MRQHTLCTEIITLIIRDLTKTKHRIVLLHIVSKKIMTNTTWNRTQFDIALGNHT